MISTDIAWPVVLSCWCSTHQQCGQGISVSAVDWQQLPTARIWDQFDCFPLPLRHRRRYCPAGELALSPPPSPSLQPLSSLLASACELSRRPRLPAPSRRRCSLLAITAITATQACSLSAPCCRHASSMLQASSPLFGRSLDMGPVMGFAIVVSSDGPSLLPGTGPAGELALSPQPSPSLQ